MKRLLVLSLLITISTHLFGMDIWFRFDKVSSDSIKWNVEIGRINIDQPRNLIIIFSNRTQVYRIVDKINKFKFKVRDRRRNASYIEIRDDDVIVYSGDIFTIYKIVPPHKPSNP